MMRKLTGGPAGLVGFPTLNNIEIPGLLQIEFATSKVPFYYLFLGLTIFSLIILYRLEQSRIGMHWKAIEQSSLVASSVGIDETKSRVIGFAAGCLFAGLAGSSFAHYTGVLTPTSFGLIKSIELVIYMLFGGTGSFAGPIIGVVVLVTIPEVFRGLAEYAPFVLGGLMLLVVFLMPEGLVGLLGRAKTD
jgi:branched-chain amino acid transport system permease protein